MGGTVLSDAIDFNWNGMRSTKLKGGITMQEIRELPLLVVDELPSKKMKGRNPLALFHPEMEKYLEVLREKGYELVIDPTNSLYGAGAYFAPSEKLISLNPNSSWQTFLHGFQHLEFHELIKREFYTFQDKIIRQGSSMEDLLQPEIVSYLGPKKIQRLDKLMGQGLPVTAVNETMSVSDELDLIGFKKWVPSALGGKLTSAALTQDYALRHQINELRKILDRGATLTDAQKGALRQALLKRLGGNGVLVADLLIMGVPPVAIISGGIHYIKEKNIYLYKDDEGSWHIVQGIKKNQ